MDSLLPLPAGSRPLDCDPTEAGRALYTVLARPALAARVDAMLLPAIELWFSTAVRLAAAQEGLPVLRTHLGELLRHPELIVARLHADSAADRELASHVLDDGAVAPGVAAGLAALLDLLPEMLITPDGLAAPAYHDLRARLNRLVSAASPQDLGTVLLPEGLVLLVATGQLPWPGAEEEAAILSRVLDTFNPANRRDADLSLGPDRPLVIAGRTIHRRRERSPQPFLLENLIAGCPCGQARETFKQLVSMPLRDHLVVFTELQNFVIAHALA